MKSLLRKHKPNSIDELSADNALFRPGALDAKIEDKDSPHFGKTMVDIYLERVSGESEVEYDHPLLEEIQEETMGVFVFQETVMRASVALAGYSLSDSDNLRSIIGKKKLEQIPIEKKKFVEGCLSSPSFIEGAKEIGKDPQKIVEDIWKQIESHGRYSFNKSHKRIVA